MRSHWSGPLTQDDWCPQGENRDVTTEAEYGVTQLHAEGLQGPTGTPEEAAREEPVQGLRGSAALCTP